MSRKTATFLPVHPLDVPFLSETPRKRSDPLITARKALAELAVMGIDCSTPAALFDELDRRGLSFTVEGPVHFNARISFFDISDPDMQSHELLATASALSLVGALAVCLYCVLRDYPEHRQPKREPRRYPTL